MGWALLCSGRQWICADPRICGLEKPRLAAYGSGKRACVSQALPVKPFSVLPEYRVELMQKCGGIFPCVK